MRMSAFWPAEARHKSILSEARPVVPPAPGPFAAFLRLAWLPTFPFRALKAQLSGARVSCVSGDNLEEASSEEKGAEVAIVFAYQWESGGSDLKSLDLLDSQNRLIDKVAGANPRTIVLQCRISGGRINALVAACGWEYKDVVGVLHSRFCRLSLKCL